MATKKKESTNEVATPKTRKAPKTTPHKVVRADFGLKVGQEISLDVTGVQFYKSKKVIK